MPPRAPQPPAMPLRSLREAVGKTQAIVGAAGGLAQTEICALEKRADLEQTRIRTLRRYVEGLGGELELVAVIGGARFIVGARPAASEE